MSADSPLPLHPVQRRFRAEELVRLRRPDEQRRYASGQRRGRIDANPHQVDAVIFALSRLPEGGCILADEVGLGKTVEAGLVIAQVLAEGVQRVLLVLPKPLIGQWQSELFELFSIEARADGEATAFAEAGVYVVGREYAGSERGSALLASSPPFDLVVIDEAHEIFAGIYRRFDKAGNYRDDDELKAARMAHRVRQFLTRHTAVLLLTATPIQNSLTELWGLVQYVERTGTLLGEIGTFRELFCMPQSKDRMLVPEQADELRRRLNKVVQRTLRRQANDFLEHQFTARSARLFTYRMSPDERQLYDHVTDYLLEPHLCAFRGSQRQLLLIGFHRRMASSSAALRASLAGVTRRLERMLAGDIAEFASISAEFAMDLDGDEPPLIEDEEPGELPGADRIRDELARVQGFIARCDALPTDTKAGYLLRAMAFILERGQSGKAVIFTESLKTQHYLREVLLAGDLGLSDGDITLFRGSNDSPRAAEAYARWESEVGDRLPKKPDFSVGVRLALVHEFQHHSRIFIATEAGGKGLNLQFCDTIIN
jgi:SNF2 family DNA or RNA helicase